MYIPEYIYTQRYVSVSLSCLSVCLSIRPCVCVYVSVRVPIPVRADIPCFHGCLPNHHHVATQAGVQSGHARLRRVPFHRGFCAVIDYKLRLQARVVGSFARQVTRLAPTHLIISECSRMLISRAGGEGGQGRPTVPLSSRDITHCPPKDTTFLPETARCYDFAFLFSS